MIPEFPPPPTAELPPADVPLAEVPLSADAPRAGRPLVESLPSDLPLSDLPLSDLPSSDLPSSDLSSSDQPPSDLPPSTELTTHGVGPWPGEWPDDARYDPELLRHGDTRNVIDRYRYWRMEAVVADLDEHRHPFHVAIENWQHDMNIGSIVRSANAFAADTVHIIGRRRWNKRGAMVTDRYQHVLHHDDVEGFVAWARAARLPIVAVDNVPGSVLIETFALPRECVLLFGQEGPGLSAAALEAADVVVEISQFGSTRSINASAAAAVAMHAWVLQHVSFT